MTDNEIIKALECCVAETEYACAICPLHNDGWCVSTRNNATLALINRQKAEIESLDNSLAISKKEIKRCVANYKTIKADAVKEFAFMLKAMAAGRLAWDEYDEEICGFLAVDEIDNLVKEFTGEEEND